MARKTGFSREKTPPSFSFFCFFFRLPKAEIHIARGGQPGDGHEGGDDLAKILRIHLVQRVARRMVVVEIIGAILT